MMETEADTLGSVALEKMEAADENISNQIGTVVNKTSAWDLQGGEDRHSLHPEAVEISMKSEPETARSFESVTLDPESGGVGNSKGDSFSKSLSLAIKGSEEISEASKESEENIKPLPIINEELKNGKHMQNDQPKYIVEETEADHVGFADSFALSTEQKDDKHLEEELPDEHDTAVSEDLNLQENKTDHGDGSVVDDVKQTHEALIYDKQDSAVEHLQSSDNIHHYLDGISRAVSDDPVTEVVSATQSLEEDKEVMSSQKDEREGKKSGEDSIVSREESIVKNVKVKANNEQEIEAGYLDYPCIPIKEGAEQSEIKGDEPDRKDESSNLLEKIVADNLNPSILIKEKGKESAINEEEYESKEKSYVNGSETISQTQETADEKEGNRDPQNILNSLTDATSPERPNRETDILEVHIPGDEMVIEETQKSNEEDGCSPNKASTNTLDETSLKPTYLQKERNDDNATPPEIKDKNTFDTIGSGGVRDAEVLENQDKHKPEIEHTDIKAQAPEIMSNDLESKANDTDDNMEGAATEQMNKEPQMVDAGEDIEKNIKEEDYTVGTGEVTGNEITKEEERLETPAAYEDIIEPIIVEDAPDHSTQTTDKEPVIEGFETVGMEKDIGEPIIEEDVVPNHVTINIKEEPTKDDQEDHEVTQGLHITYVDKATTQTITEDDVVLDQTKAIIGEDPMDGCHKKKKIIQGLEITGEEKDIEDPFVKDNDVPECSTTIMADVSMEDVHEKDKETEELDISSDDNNTAKPITDEDVPKHCASIIVEESTSMVHDEDKMIEGPEKVSIDQNIGEAIIEENLNCIETIVEEPNENGPKENKVTEVSNIVDEKKDAGIQIKEGDVSKCRTIGEEQVKESNEEDEVSEVIEDKSTGEPVTMDDIVSLHLTTTILEEAMEFGQEQNKVGLNVVKALETVNSDKDNEKLVVQDYSRESTTEDNNKDVPEEEKTTEGLKTAAFVKDAKESIIDKDVVLDKPTTTIEVTEESEVGDANKETAQPAIEATEGSEITRVEKNSSEHRIVEADILHNTSSFIEGSSFNESHGENKVIEGLDTVDAENIGEPITEEEITNNCATTNRKEPNKDDQEDEIIEQSKTANDVKDNGEHIVKENVPGHCKTTIREIRVIEGLDIASATDIRESSIQESVSDHSTRPIEEEPTTKVQEEDKAFEVLNLVGRDKDTEEPSIQKDFVTDQSIKSTGEEPVKDDGSIDKIIEELEYKDVRKPVIEEDVHDNSTNFIVEEPTKDGNEENKVIDELENSGVDKENGEAIKKEVVLPSHSTEAIAKDAARVGHEEDKDNKSGLSAESTSKAPHHSEKVVPLDLEDDEEQHKTNIAQSVTQTKQDNRSDLSTESTSEAPHSSEKIESLDLEDEEEQHKNHHAEGVGQTTVGEELHQNSSEAPNETSTELQFEERAITEKIDLATPKHLEDSQNNLDEDKMKETTEEETIQLESSEMIDEASSLVPHATEEKKNEIIDEEEADGSLNNAFLVKESKTEDPYEAVKGLATSLNNIESSTQNKEVCEERKEVATGENAENQIMETTSSVDVPMASIREDTTKLSSQEVKKEIERPGEVKESHLVSIEETTYSTKEATVVPLDEEHPKKSLGAVTDIEVPSEDVTEMQSSDKLTYTSTVPAMFGGPIEKEVPEKTEHTTRNHDSSSIPLHTEDLSLHESNPELEELVDASSIAPTDTFSTPSEDYEASSRDPVVNNVMDHKVSNFDDNTMENKFNTENLDADTKQEKPEIPVETVMVGTPSVDKDTETTPLAEITAKEPSFKSASENKPQESSSLVVDNQEFHRSTTKEKFHGKSLTEDETVDKKVDPLEEQKEEQMNMETEEQFKIEEDPEILTETTVQTISNPESEKEMLTSEQEDALLILEREKVNALNEFRENSGSETSDSDLKQNKVENEEKTDEPTGTCSDNATDTLEEEEDRVEKHNQNLEESKKASGKVEEMLVDFKATDDSYKDNKSYSCTENVSLTQKNLEADDLSAESKISTESVDHGQSREALLEAGTSEAVKETEIIKELDATPVERHAVGNNIDEEKTENNFSEAGTKLEELNQIDDMNDVNTLKKITIVNEKMPHGVDGADGSEKIEKQNINEEAAKSEEVVDKSIMKEVSLKLHVKDSDSISTGHSMEATYCTEKEEPETSTYVEEHNKKGDVNPGAESSKEELPKREDCDKHEEVFGVVSEVDEDSIQTDTIERDRAEVLHIAPVTLVTEETSGWKAKHETEKAVEGYSTSNEVEITNIQNTSHKCTKGEDTEEVSVDITSGLVSQPPTIKNENLDQEILTVEKEVREVAESETLKYVGELNKMGNLNPIANSSKEKLPDQEYCEKHEEVSSGVSRADEDSIHKGVKERDTAEVLHMAPDTGVTEETSGLKAQHETEKVVDEYSSSTEADISKIDATIHTSIKGEDTEGVSLDITSDVVSQPPTTKNENIDQESVPVEKDVKEIPESEMLTYVEELNKKGDVNPDAESSAEESPKQEACEKHEEVFSVVFEVNEDSIQKDIKERDTAEMLHIAPVTVVTEEMSGLKAEHETEKVVEGYSSSTEAEVSKIDYGIQTCIKGEKAEGLSLDITSGLVSQPPTIKNENIDQESVAMEKDVSEVTGSKALTYVEELNKEGDVTPDAESSKEELSKREDREKHEEAFSAVAALDENNIQKDIKERDIAQVFHIAPVTLVTKETGSLNAKRDTEKVVEGYNSSTEEEISKMDEKVHTCIKREDTEGVNLDITSGLVSQPPNTKNKNTDQERLAMEKDVREVAKSETLIYVEDLNKKEDVNPDAESSKEELPKREDPERQEDAFSAVDEDNIQKDLKERDTNEVLHIAPVTVVTEEMGGLKEKHETEKVVEEYSSTTKSEISKIDDTIDTCIKEDETQGDSLDITSALVFQPPTTKNENIDQETFAVEKDVREVAESDILVKSTEENYQKDQKKEEALISGEKIEETELEILEKTPADMSSTHPVAESSVEKVCEVGNVDSTSDSDICNQRAIKALVGDGRVEESFHEERKGESINKVEHDSDDDQNKPNDANTIMDDETLTDEYKNSDIVLVEQDINHPDLTEKTETVIVKDEVDKRRKVDALPVKDIPFGEAPMGSAKQNEEESHHLPEHLITEYATKDASNPEGFVEVKKPSDSVSDTYTTNPTEKLDAEKELPTDIPEASSLTEASWEEVQEKDNKRTMDEEKEEVVSVKNISHEVQLQTEESRENKEEVSVAEMSEDEEKIAGIHIQEEICSNEEEAIPTGPVDLISKPLEIIEVEEQKQGEAQGNYSEVDKMECEADKTLHQPDEGTSIDSRSSEAGVSLFDLLHKSTKPARQTTVEEPAEDSSSRHDKGEEENKETLTAEESKAHRMEEKEKVEEEEEDNEDEHKKDDSGSDALVIVEASRDIEVKTTPKKSHNILSGVGSKVKHSISKVKKAITGKSSHHKQSSPKQESG